VFKLNEGADGVSIAICAQKHRVQASIFLHRLTKPLETDDDLTRLRHELVAIRREVGLDPFNLSGGIARQLRLSLFDCERCLAPEIVLDARQSTLARMLNTFKQQLAPGTFVYSIAALVGAVIGTAIGRRWMSERGTRYVLAAILLFAGIRLLFR
jgi:uncharacterized membrane protein YeaQ/YmgE (transglycosylase-associated protein family)